MRIGKEINLNDYNIFHDFVEDVLDTLDVSLITGYISGAFYPTKQEVELVGNDSESFIEAVKTGEYEVEE